MNNRRGCLRPGGMALRTYRSLRSRLQCYRYRKPCTKLMYSPRCRLLASAGNQDLDWTLLVILRAAILAFSYLTSAKTLQATLRSNQLALRKIPGRRREFSPNSNRFFQALAGLAVPAEFTESFPFSQFFGWGIILFRYFLIGHGCALSHWLILPFKLSARREENRSRDVLPNSRNL